jgi:hypothetical protein
LFWEYFKTARTFIFLYIFYILYSEDDLWLQIKNEMSWSGFEQEEETRYSSSLPSRTRMAGRRDFTSVAEPGCLSPIPDPDCYTSRIPDPKAATKERCEKKFVVLPFFVVPNFTKL